MNRRLLYIFWAEGCGSNVRYDNIAAKPEEAVTIDNSDDDLDNWIDCLVARGMYAERSLPMADCVMLFEMDFTTMTFVRTQVHYPERTRRQRWDEAKLKYEQTGIPQTP